MAEEVDVQIYIQGKGPVHKLKVPLEGWDKNKIDLESIMSKYRLRRLYAYSLTSGRGLELFFSPKNGLSLVSYSGKPGAIVRFDADPKASIWQLLGRISMCIVLLALVFLGTTNSQADWVLKVQELGGGRIAWLGCFLVMLVTQLAWKPF
jgi:hypothetical protein